MFCKYNIYEIKSMENNAFVLLKKSESTSQKRLYSQIMYNCEVDIDVYKNRNNYHRII